MSPSPTKHRQLSRQQSHPSLALGLPPELASFNIMQPSPSSHNLHKRTRSVPRIHRGDVSSSAASSDNEEEWTSRDQTTPKRKVVGLMDPVPVVKSSRARETLQQRLEKAAKIKKSKSTGDHLGITATTSTLDIFAAASTSKTVTTAVETPQPPSAVVSPPVRSRMSRDALKAQFSTIPVLNPSDKVVVCVRVKPTSSTFASLAYEVTPTSLTLSDSHPNVQKRGGKAGREDEYTYSFDKLLMFPSTTPELYTAKVSPLVEKTMNGFNSTIFAYGQTGSGKSFTMTGVPEELGIIPCAVDGVFDAINAEPERAFLLRVSYVEIYNETLRDLLNFKKAPLRDDEKPVIHTAKGKVYVDPLVEEVVSSPQDVVDLLERGNAGRKIGATDWNERSSRSHCVFTIVIESRPREGEGDDDIRLSRLNLIDLAGSERAVSDAERRGEGKYINQSLLALREVINKLTEKRRSHVPYRNSKLTHLLENALGGDSNICVICTMSAEEEHCSETLETLKFAGRCSQVETKAKKNVLQSSDRALIKAKDAEINDLRSRLQQIASGTGAENLDSSEQISSLAESLATMEARKAKLSADLAKLNGEILTSELPRSGSGMMSPARPKRRRISDIASIVGNGIPKKIVERRAISGMERVVEEHNGRIMERVEAVTAEIEVTKSFDNDRTIAALRRALTAKEAELVDVQRDLTKALVKLPERDAQLSTLRSELSTLRAQFAASTKSHDNTTHRHETESRDLQSQLESIRAELVAKIGDKSSKTDELERLVLDLRTSRQDVAIEYQETIDQLKAQIDEAEKACKALSIDQSFTKNELLKTQQAVQDLSARIESSKSTSVAEKALRDLEHKDLVTKHGTTITTLQSTSSRAFELEAVSNSLRVEVASLLDARESMSRMVDDLKIDKASAEKGRLAAVGDLERYQKVSIGAESDMVRELREETGRLRKEKDADKVAWRIEREKIKLDHDTLAKQLREEKEREATAVKRARGAEKEVEALQDRLRDGEDVSSSRIRELESENKALVADLEVQRGRSGHVVEQKIELDRLRKESDDIHSQLTSKAAMEADLHQQVQATQAEVRRLSREDQARTLLTEEQRKAVEQASVEMATLQAQSASLQIHLDASRFKGDELESAISSMRVENQQLKGARADSDTRAQHLRVENERLARQMDQQRQGAESLEIELRGLVSAAEARTSEVVQLGVKEVQRLKQELLSIERRLSETSQHHLEARSLVTSLEKELDELKLASNKRHSAPWTANLASASMTSIHAATGLDDLRIQALTTAASSVLPAGRSRTREMEEVDRLELVVEAQRGMIDEQREKIKYWARELEHQREVVRLLTSEPTTTSTSPRASPRISHGKSRSMSIMPSPTHSTPGTVSHIKTSFPNTFTARNLALPTSPSPLPMNPSQFDNRNGKRSTRRVTIEHDIDRLAESSKVNRAKAIFEHPNASPTKGSTPVKSFGMLAANSGLKQRRP